MKIISRFVVVLTMAFAASVPGARAAITSTFDAGDEGWSIVSFGDLPSSNYNISGTYAPVYSATGGNPGGYISSTDPDGGDFTFSAPAKFLGNQLAAVGTNFSYDLNYLTTVNYQTTDVIFLGVNGERLLWKSSPDFVPTPAFTNVAFSLSPSTQWHINTTSGAQPTSADFQAVFGNLAGLYIRGEYESGPDNTGLDNVFMVPEPGAWALLAVAGAVVGFAIRRRRAAASSTR